MIPYLEDTKSVLADVESSTLGLTDEMVKTRLEKFGPNKLAEGKKESLLHRFLKQLAEPMLIILIVAAVLSVGASALSGETDWSDAIIILVVVLVNSILGVMQESKAEKAIAALQEISSPTCKVRRNGNQVVIHSCDLVPGDILILEAGDSIAADSRILESASLKCEEAALTGESVPSDKVSSTLSSPDNKPVPLGDRKNMVYLGSSVVYGRATAVVLGTGMNTEIGKIADALQNASDMQTPLQIKLKQLSKILTYLVLCISVIILAINVIRMNLTHTFTLTGLMSSFMIAISLAVAAIPEGLAAVVTIVLSIGVTKMSKNKAIIRKLTAVETLGCTSIICSDKTGTLTQNKMTVVQDYSEDQLLLAKALSLCNDAVLDENFKATGEPTECALVNFAYKVGLNKNELQKVCYERVAEAPFDSIRKMMSTIHTDPDGKYVQFTKGAPDEILKVCTKALLKDGKIAPLTNELKEEILKKNQSLADSALRVLAASFKPLDTIPTNVEPKAIENELIFIGLVGMIDPIRPEVKAAVAECNEAGIRPIMITGDHIDTAVAIAKELGIIKDKSQAITGSFLDSISEDAFAKDVQKYSVYARVQPEHKVRIVKAWQQLGKVTAMTGDGVNDAPAIKNADIGVGMGITGTDVTKNVADMVLADDNFATIVEAVAEGRRIYDNIKKAIQFLLASNLAEVIAIFVASLMNFTILKPAHLLWINLITDSFPAVGLGMEEAEDDIMKRPPRDKKEGVFANGLGTSCIIQGFIIALITIFAYFVGEYLQNGVWAIKQSSEGMTMAFLTLSMAELLHSFNMRSLTKSIFHIKGHNKYLYFTLIGAFILTLAVLYIPFLSAAFGFEHITIMEFIVSLVIAFTIIPLVEIQKFITRKLSKKK